MQEERTPAARNGKLLEALANRLEQLPPTADPDKSDQRRNEPAERRQARPGSKAEEALRDTQSARRAADSRTEILNLEIGISGDGRIGGMAAFAVQEAKRQGIQVPENLKETGGLQEHAAALLGLDSDTARTLFDGPNSISGARRWIEPADAAGACRLAAAGGRPRELWPQVDTVKLREKARAESVEMYHPETERGAGSPGDAYGYPLGAISSTVCSKGTPLGGCLISPDAQVNPSAKVERDTEIGPGTQIGHDASIGRHTIVAANVVIGEGAKIREASEIGFGGSIGANADVEGCTCPNVRIGRDAIVRPATPNDRPAVIGEGSWIGDKAEVVGQGDRAVPPGTQVSYGMRLNLRDLAVNELAGPAGDDRAPDKQTGRIDPTAKVDKTAHIARDAEVGPGCEIGPWTTIEAGAVLEAKVTLQAEAVVEKGARIREDCLLEAGAWVGQEATVGTNSRLGANSRVAANTRIEDGPRDDGRLVRNVRQMLPAGSQMEGSGYLPVQESDMEFHSQASDGERPGFVESSAQVAEDVRIAQCAHIGAGVRIDPGVTIGGGAQIGSGSRVERGATIGAYAVLEPETKVGPDENVARGETIGPKVDPGGRRKNDAGERRETGSRVHNRASAERSGPEEGAESQASADRKAGQLSVPNRPTPGSTTPRVGSDNRQR